MTNVEKAARDRVRDQSPDFRDELLIRLKQAAPEIFAEGKLDILKLGELLGEAADSKAERYTFSWAGRREAIAMLQTPTRATLAADLGRSVDFDNARHVFIEGENLEVLKVLYRSYFGRVKFIYIDPPYNTGNDFVYPDNFSDPLDHYLRLTEQKDSEGNYQSSNDLSPVSHPFESRIRSSFGPVRSGVATGRGAKPPVERSAPACCGTEALRAA